jgi:lactoylglutathione lyase
MDLGRYSRKSAGERNDCTLSLSSSKVGGASVPRSTMRVEKVKYVLWAADWQRCLKFYRELFGGVVSFESEVWSEIVIAGATLGIHGGGEGKRTWTGLSFQLDDLREGIARLLECGGALTREPNDTPEDPLHLAMCVDSEGNEFMMTQKRH